MAKANKTAISPTRAENYPEWYQQVVRSAELAENSPVRGCMVIKPWGYSLWENMQAALDQKFKETGHTNAYFPLFIPKSYLEKEAKHIEGFAKECAVVTHSRLEKGEEDELVPASPLEEPLIVRPTSETIIGEMYARWTQSYRDLPILINQWANVVRWEMRTRLFLRTTEFLWQEGHTAHATREEAMDETHRMLRVYQDFAEKHMAMPVICGEKSEGERFPGAEQTLCIEAMMQDKRALQAGTSHFLGQNFARSCGIDFLDENDERQYAWTTSWGVSTRLIGAMIMTHSDDDGLVLPPALAPAHAVILPVLHKEDSTEAILAYARDLKEKLESYAYRGRAIKVELDTRDLRGGEKKWQWVRKGVPVRIEVGPRDLEQGAAVVSRRDHPPQEKENKSTDSLVSEFPQLLDEIQQHLYQRAQATREEHTCNIDSKDDFYAYFSAQTESNGGDQPTSAPGFAMTHWAGDAQLEQQLANDLKVTLRCIPADTPQEEGTCPFTGKPSPKRVLFAKAY